tara:strand:- start:669 stop:1733 length:1065 start_codon:yes stop_codon:yes gene_type:complete
MKKYNFSPGPAKLDNSILKRVNEDILEYRDTGVSILEISHRSENFQDILNKTKSNLSDLLDIPSNYKLLFLQGGATFHNTFIANNIEENKYTANLITGTWGQKTYEDYVKIRDSKKISLESHQITQFLAKPLTDEIQKIDFMHITSNETIEGIQLRNFNKIKKDLIIDSSSDIGSYKFDWENIACIYAGAQKNLGIPGVTISIIRDDFVTQNNNPTYLNLSKLINKDSLLNTPPTFSIYVLKLVTDWMLKKGGVEYFEKKSIEYSSEVYTLLQKYEDHVVLPVEYSSRSRMNVVFNFKNEKNEKVFIHESLNHNIIGIKGHRSVGGVRISLYNSIDRPSIDFLLEFMDSFFQKL